MAMSGKFDSLALVAIGAGFLIATTGAACAHELSASGREERMAREFREIMERINKEQIEGVIAKWYAELQKGEDGNAYRLLAPQAIVEDCECLLPGETPVKYALPPFRSELAYSALKFSYEIEKMRLDRYFARVEVWERGWYYAWSAKTTYENDADTTFVLERDDKGEWTILAFSANSIAVHPKYADDPMPDLRDEFFRRFPDRK
jgi:hypothetical protein